MWSSRVRRVLEVFIVVAGTSSGYLAAQDSTKDPTPPPPGLRGTAPKAGAPDGFGYVVRNSADGIPFQFIDISTTGTKVVEGDDASSSCTTTSCPGIFGGVGIGAPIVMPRSFTLYGVEHTQMVMSSNGYLATDLGDLGPDLSNDCPLPAVPSTPIGTTGARIYPLHDDLDLEPGIGAGYYQYFATCPRPADQLLGGDNGCSVFMWDNVAHFPGGGAAPTFDVEVILYHRSGEIVIQVGPGNPELGAGSTTGIQSHSPPAYALTYSCDEPNSIPNNTVVAFFEPGFTRYLASIPTLNEYGLLLLILAFCLSAAYLLRHS